MLFLQGTRSALYSNDRESITVTVQEVTPRAVGAMIALYERAVGIYASVVNINAYHQPGTILIHQIIYALCFSSKNIPIPVYWDFSLRLSFEIQITPC